jgi:hypothetical protein
VTAFPSYNSNMLEYTWEFFAITEIISSTVMSSRISFSVLISMNVSSLLLARGAHNPHPRAYCKGQLGSECVVGIGKIFGQWKMAHWAVTIWAVDLNSNILHKVRVLKLTESINTFRSMSVIMIKPSLSYNFRHNLSPKRS